LLESYPSPSRTTRIYNAEEDITDRSDRASQAPGLNLWGDSSVTAFPLEHNLSNRQALSNDGVLHETRENSLLPSLSRQFEPPTSTFARGYSVPHNNIDNTPKQKTVIGIVYVTCSPHENVPAGEANIGIIITPEARGKGLAREATSLVLSWVFDDIGFHRVQARILDNYNKDRAISMFTQLGFVHEGIRRRSVYCPNEGVRGAWKDVTYLALLETEWLMRSYLKPAPKNLWDEMFARHAREREELLRWDERQQRLKRTSSMDTVRVLDTPSETASTIDEETGDRPVTPASVIDTSSVHEGKRRRLDTDPLDRQSQASSPPPSESEQSDASWEMENWDEDEASGHIQLPPSAYISRTVRDADSLSDSSGPGRGSASGSNWDMLETSSVSSSSFESLGDSDE